MRSLLLLTLLLTACGPRAPDDDDAPDFDPADLPQGLDPPRDPIVATIVSVFDGDTARVDDEDGFSETVRFLNIDTPETGDCWAGQATAAAEELLPVGQSVWLTWDGELRDGFGRLLCHLFVGEEPTEQDWVNLQLVTAGHASAFIFDANDTYRDTFEDAEREARDAGLGQWGACF
jgi:micrococcal nuclease